MKSNSIKKHFNNLFPVIIIILISILALSADTAEDIIKETGIQGGLIVHLGIDSSSDNQKNSQQAGKLTAALYRNHRYIVHGLDTNRDKVNKARQYIQSQGLYGKVTIDHFNGKELPYVRDLVNLLVVSDQGDVSMEEILRVLAPHGVAYIKKGNKWQKKVKPRPGDTDEWSHFMHDAGGNAVAEDKQIGPPTALRWVAGPRWCRSHEFPSSVNAVVTVGGRIFTIFDEGPTGVYVDLPQKVHLIARDAYNGIFLWKIPLKDWQSEFGTGEGNRWNIHHTIPRRLVASAGRVYATLQFLNSPVSVMDAATGKILIEALPGTQGADELLLLDDILIVKTTKERSVPAMATIGQKDLNNSLVAVNIKTGKQIWNKENVNLAPYALSAWDNCVVYHDLLKLTCLDIKTGKKIWQATNTAMPTKGGGSTLVIKDNVVLYHGFKPESVKAEEPATQKNKKKGKKKKGKKGALKNSFITAHSLKTGKQIWTQKGHKPLSAASTLPTDTFVAKGIVWYGNSQKGYDLHTGKLKKELSFENLITSGHHYRCHRAKATERYMIWPKRGAEFVDLDGDNHMRHDWLRSPCFTGATPANGLFYTPPHQCFCYPGVLVTGFLALSADQPAKWSKMTDSRLEKGTAYKKISSQKTGSEDDWPMYRRDNQRSGSTKMKIPVKLNKKWEIKLKSRGTQPIIVGNHVIISERDNHCIRCLNVNDGKEIWSFIADGRVDSSPTIHQGMVLFGTRNGSVYCLRQSDGELSWQFMAEKKARKTVSFEQVESLWPVHGSVLVQDNIVYFGAGRSSFLDQGIMAYGLDVQTGEVRYRHLLSGPKPDLTKQDEFNQAHAMEGALPDIFVSDGKDLYMRRIKFDSKLNRLETKWDSSLGEMDMGAIHLTATGGFLDDSGYDRIFWMYSKLWPGFYLAQHSPKAGQLVVFDDSTTYAVKYYYRRVSWSPIFYPGKQGYLLFADDNNNEPNLQEKGKEIKVISWLPEGADTDKHRRGGRGVDKGMGYIRQEPEKWKKMIPLRIRAMVAAEEHLFAAGTPDLLDPEDPLAAFEGRKGALLQVFKKKDGELVKSYQLKSEPAFDGLSAAQGKLFMVTLDGKLICYSDISDR